MSAHGKNSISCLDIKQRRLGKMKTTFGTYAQTFLIFYLFTTTGRRKVCTHCLLPPCGDFCLVPHLLRRVAIFIPKKKFLQPTTFNLNTLVHILVKPIPDYATIFAFTHSPPPLRSRNFLFTVCLFLVRLSLFPIFKLRQGASIGSFCWMVGWSDGRLVVGKKCGKMWKLIAAMCKTKTTEPELIVQLRLLTINPF